MIRSLTVFLIALITITGVAYAQAPDPAVDPTTIDWRQALALLINVPVLYVLGQLLKKVVPKINPRLMQLIVLVASPLVLTGQAYLTGLVGYPIDLSIIVTILAGGSTGLAAMVLHDQVRGGLGLLKSFPPDDAKQR